MSEKEESKQRPLHPAEIAKAEAEARLADAQAEAELIKANAEAEKFRGEAELSKMLIKLNEASLTETNLRLVEVGYNVDRSIEKRKKELTADEFHHTYTFDSGVDTSSYKKCLEQLKAWDRNEEPTKVAIEFFSPGGSVLAGMALFDAITAMQQRGWHFTTLCRGYAASMGGILLQAGDVRVCGPESYILIHEVSSGAVGKIGELEDEVEFVKMIQNRVLEIFVKRSSGKVTKAKLQAMYRRKDFWLDSDKALKLGIVDEIR